ncbi:hypothetical protein GGF37_001479 [Kickxella alabastrina]|nr:hypothetical protein GGF37_001479 [Kickxella alabastrina]
METDAASNHHKCNESQSFSNDEVGVLMDNLYKASHEMINPCQQEPGHNAFRNQLPTATTAAEGATAANAASDDWLIQICRENEALCKQLKDFYIECKELAGIKAQLAEAQADKKRVDNENANLRAQLQDVNALLNHSQTHIS